MMGSFSERGTGRPEQSPAPEIRHIRDVMAYEIAERTGGHELYLGSFKSKLHAIVGYTDLRVQVNNLPYPEKEGEADPKLITCWPGEFDPRKGSDFLEISLAHTVVVLDKDSVTFVFPPTTTGLDKRTVQSITLRRNENPDSAGVSFNWERMKEDSVIGRASLLARNVLREGTPAA